MTPVPGPGPDWSEIGCTAGLIAILLFFIGGSVYYAFFDEPEQKRVDADCLPVPEELKDGTRDVLGSETKVTLTRFGAIRAYLGLPPGPDFPDIYHVSAKVEGLSADAEDSIATWEWWFDRRSQDWLSVCAQDELAERIGLPGRCDLKSSLVWASEQCVR